MDYIVQSVLYSYWPLGKTGNSTGFGVIRSGPEAPDPDRPHKYSIHRNY
jgi:hypothetical protein